jgi:hypothetical protein
LCQTHHVAPLQDNGNRLPLDWRWNGETGCFDSSGYMRIERKLFEIQRELLDPIEPSRNLSPMMLGKSLCRLWCESYCSWISQKV